MSKDILSLISSKMNTFSKGQKLIANYILSSYDKAAFMTASKLGKTVHVSESTVVRFASELKYDGYPAMQKALQEMIRNKLTSIQRIEVTNDIIGNQDVVSTVMQSDMEKIRLTMEEIDRDSFQAAVDAIVNAKKIYILGTRSSGSLAGFMSFYFGLMFDNVVHVGESANQEIFDQIVQVGHGDVTIGLSFPRYSRRTVRAINFAHERGSKVIAITSSACARSATATGSPATKRIASRICGISFGSIRFLLPGARRQHDALKRSVLTHMRLAQLQKLQQSDEQRDHLFTVRLIAEQFVKADAAQHQAALDGLHASFHGMAVAPDIAQAEIHLARLGRTAALHAQQRLPQRLQRQPVQLQRGRGQGVFLRQLAKELEGALFKLRHVARALAELLVRSQAGDQGLFRVLLFLAGRLGQEAAALDFHQQRGHGDELAGLVHVKIRRAAHDFDILLGDLAHEDVLEVDLGLAHQVQKQVQWPIELL